MKNDSGLSGKRILIAEDDNDIRNSVKTMLEMKGATVHASEHGLAAKMKLEEPGAGFDLLLSDIRMPHLDGIQLLQFAKKAHPQLKVIIFTGFSEYLETQSAAELGADGFLAKPFKLAELLTMIEELTGSQANHRSLTENDFCRIGVDEFFSTTRLVSDIYIRINETKFIKLAKENSEIDVSRLHHIKEHRVTHLFVRTEDFHKYTGMNLRLAQVVEKKDAVSEEKKMRVFKHTGEMLVQQAFMTNIEKSVCDNAFAMVKNTLKCVSSNEDLLDVLMSMQSKADDLYSHSVNVTVQASLMATELGWTTPSNQTKISLAALFHDIGFKELPSDLRKKPRFKMDGDEVKLFESHTFRGRDILKSIHGYPADLATIVGQHHETCDGAGYPASLNGSKTHPLAKLIHLADEFVLQIETLGIVDPGTPKAILNDFFDNRRDEFDLECLAAAFDLYKVQRPVGLKNKAA